jgi:hypothetical protein
MTDYVGVLHLPAICYNKNKTKTKKSIMTTIYLHIGMPKTGTTSLQKFLFDNREKLLEKGYLYPLSGMMSNGSLITFNHHGLGKALLKKYDPKYLVIKNSRSGRIQWESSWEDLKKEIKVINPQNVIISSECFTFKKEFYDLDIIAMVKKMLEEYETKIVIYLRRQDDFLRSLYCHYMKSPFPNKVPTSWILNNENTTTKNMKEMREFIEQFKYQANYYSTIELWKKTFGIKSVIVKPFERGQMKNGSLVDDFLETINFGQYDENDFKFSNF